MTGIKTNPRAVHVLGIETSCDDTGVAIVRDDGRILSNCIHSQLKQHIDHGGIMPMLAKEYHLENIDRVARQAMAESGLASVADDIDAIAVTNRPGLSSSLQVGLNYARRLAQKYSKPLIPIHHMQAHALMPLLNDRSIRFPFMTLLISGGHCLIAMCQRYNKFQLMGQSLDDAPGDLLDKVARRLRVKDLGEPYDRISGGAAVEKLASRDGSDRFKYYRDELSIPMLRHRGCDLSFSGYRGNFDKMVPMIDELWASGNRDSLMPEISHVCSSIQRAILIQIFRKLQRAMQFYRMRWRHANPLAFQETDADRRLGFGIRDVDDNEYLDIVISGGVAANQYLVDSLRSCCHSDIDPELGDKLFSPPKHLCNDNGLMIAWNGMLRYIDLAGKDNPKSKDSEAQQIDDHLVYDQDSMNLIKVDSSTPIGEDISEVVQAANFKLGKTKNPEVRLKLNQKHSPDLIR